jgi:hypothetical protein
MILIFISENEAIWLAEELSEWAVFCIWPAPKSKTQLPALVSAPKTEE